MADGAYVARLFRWRGYAQDEDVDPGSRADWEDVGGLTYAEKYYKPGAVEIGERFGPGSYLVLVAGYREEPGRGEWYTVDVIETQPPPVYEEGDSAALLPLTIAAPSPAAVDEIVTAETPVPGGCTGHRDPDDPERILHDGATCPLHEEGGRLDG